jgi:anaerobic selenocysteine-containing dehydrogenase
MGGQTVRAICALPAITGQYGCRGGGLAYSTSGITRWDWAAINHWDECPQPGRRVNMNRLGAALLGEASDPPIMSLYVFGSNPAAIAPNAGRVVAGLQREELFTVVQLEQSDLHKAYGHTNVAYNRQAIEPLGQARSNWDVMRLLAREMGFDEPWLCQSVDEVIEEVLAATAAHNPAYRDITLKQLQNEGWMALSLDSGVPFADLRFPTPSGKVELTSETLGQQGLNPLPGWTGAEDTGTNDELPPTNGYKPETALTLLTPAAHHFVTSSLANQEGLLRRERPFVEIHPDDAQARGIVDGDTVVIENGRGWCVLRALVTEAVRPGVVAAAKGHWSKHHNGRNVNWTTSDALGDMAGQSTFHSNRVWIRRENRK